MSVIENTRTVGHANGCLRISVFAENVTTGVTSIFSIKPSLPDEGLSYNIDPLMSKKVETGSVNTCDGKFAGLQGGNQTYEEKTIDFTLGDDFNLVKDNVDSTLSRSILIALIRGESFIDGGDTYIIIGVTGVRNIVALTNDLDTQYLLLEDGKIIDPSRRNIDGTMFKKANNVASAYKDVNMVMMETMYAFNDNSKKGDRFAYFLGESCTFNEGSGTDFNKYAVSGTRYCDPRSISKYFIDGVTSTELVNATSPGATDIAEVGQASNGVATGAVIYGSVNTTAGVIATVTLTNGTAGDIIVLIGNGAEAGDNNELFMFVVSDASTATAIDPDYTLIKGNKIFVTEKLTGLVTTVAEVVVIDADTATTGNGYIAIKTAGSSGSAISVDWKTKSAGSGDTTYLIDIKDWGYSTSTFVAYTGE